MNLKFDREMYMCTCTYQNLQVWLIFWCPFWNSLFKWSSGLQWSGYTHFLTLHLWRALFTNRQNTSSRPGTRQYKERPECILMQKLGVEQWWGLGKSQKKALLMASTGSRWYGNSETCSSILQWEGNFYDSISKNRHTLESLPTNHLESFIQTESSTYSKQWLGHLSRNGSLTQHWGTFSQDTN